MQNFVTNLAPVAAMLGITPAEVSELEQDNEEYQSIAATTIAGEAFLASVREYRIRGDLRCGIWDCGLFRVIRGSFFRVLSCVLVVPVESGITVTTNTHEETRTRKEKPDHE
jgi:hypothetical protein